MKRWWPLVALGVAAFALFALFTLPAEVVLSRLQSSGVQASGVSGSIWKGKAQVLAVQGMHVGAVEWRLHVLPLFTARASADVKVTRVDGFLETQLTASPTGRVAFEDLTGAVPLTALPPNALRGGWTGTVNLKLAELTIEDGWPTDVEGDIEAINITGPANRPVNMGSYKATFPEDAASDGTLTARIVDLGGPLQINGALKLTAANRGYHLEGLISTRPDAPPEVAKTLEYLGPPDAQGQRQFGLEGAL